MVGKRTNTDDGKKPRVAVYARFSCDKQRDESIEDQLYEAERYCESHGYEIVVAYTDYAISGRSDDRPQFQKMIEDAKTGSFDIVLVWKMDRFARNMQDQFYHEKILADAGVRLESVKENIAGNGIEASMSKGMHAIFAQIRSQQSAEDTMRGMVGKARKCQYLGYRWFGYTHDGDEIVLDPATAPLAREVHDRYLRGESTRDILDWLNGLGIRGIHGKPVGYQYVTAILKNWAYAGVYTWGKAKDENGRVMLDVDGCPVPLVRVEDGIPAIVTKEEKERCLRRMRFGKRGHGKTDFFLSGKLYCPDCGKPMHGETCTSGSHVTKYRYVCQGKRKACNGIYWKDDVESAVAASVRAMLSDPEMVDYIAERFVKHRSKKKPSASIKAAKADLKAIVKQRDNLVKAVEDGMPYKLVKEKIEVLDARQAGVERKIEELNRAEHEITKSDVLQVLALVAEGMRSDEELLKAFVYQVWAFGDHAIAVLNILGKDCTPHEIKCAYNKTRNTRSDGVSCHLSLVHRLGAVTNDDSPVIYAEERLSVILLDSGFGVMISLKAA